MYEGHAHSIGLDLDERLPVVQGDPARLRQVIHNLLQNAEQAVSEHRSPRIIVRTRLEGPAARLAILDNGPGFPSEILTRAFEPYVTTKVKGTGLGLAIVKKIIEEHNGSIEVSNSSGGGAQVSILLPVARTTAQPESAPANVRTA